MPASVMGRTAARVVAPIPASESRLEEVEVVVVVVGVVEVGVEVVKVVEVEVAEVEVPIPSHGSFPSPWAAAAARGVARWGRLEEVEVEEVGNVVVIP